mgnify:CR=1 FL=1
MSDDAQKANEFARKNFGGEVDAAAAAPGFKILQPGETGEPPKKPSVELPGTGNRVLADFAHDLGACLADVPLFRREDVLVTVDASTGEMKLMTPERFLSWVADHVIIFEDVEIGRGDKKATLRMHKTMPLTTAKGCLQADQFCSQMRPLVRVNTVRMPYMKADGAPVLLPEGYDAESQIFTLKSEVKMDEKMAIDRAKLVFADYYGEFQGLDERSLSVAITLALALYGMALQKVEAARMGFMVRANSVGGGKSLLAQMGITPSYGLPENTARAKEEELRKILDAAVLQGVPYLFFDNLKGHFENALVEGFMTTPVWRARIMGTQRFMRGKVCCTLVVTGNNLTVSPDLQRRLLQCDVYVEEFDLQERQHKRDLNPMVLNRPDVRAEFLSALWALIRHWYEQGRPPAGTREQPYRVATFAEWSDIFGGIIQCAGYGNPLLPPPDDQNAAPIKLHQRKLVELLAAGDDVAKISPINEKTVMRDYTFQELIDCCVDNELFTWRIKGREREGDGDKKWFEVTSECASTMGLMFTNEMAGKSAKQRRFYTQPDGRRICFGKTGAGRASRYTVEFAGRKK